MAVLKRGYRTYDGALTSRQWRFLVLTRYALKQIFSSRILGGILVLSTIPTLVAIGMVYVANTDVARALLSLDPRQLVQVNNIFFMRWLQSEAWIAMAVTALIAPSIISPEVANNALPLFLSRVSRAEYVLGKFVALALLLSCITWVPGLLLFGLQASLADSQWLVENYRIAGSILAASAIWITLLVLLALALAATVRWKIIANAAIFGVFMVPAGIGSVFNVIMRTNWGSLVNLGYLMSLIFRSVFGYKPPPRAYAHFVAPDLPVAAAWAMLLAVSFLCMLLLNRNLRARQVVRG